jgi:ectoine hydroxylase-related dioxygenase (phytanoyl-CoA dioxygenase family)
MNIDARSDTTLMVSADDIASFLASGVDDVPGFLFLDRDYCLRRSPDPQSTPINIADDIAWRAYCDRYYFGHQHQQSHDYELHRWNSGFKWRSMRGPYRLISEKQAAFYDENGYVVLPGAIGPAIVERLIEETDRVEEERQRVLASLENGKGFIARANEISFTTHIVRKSSLVKNFYASQLFRDIAHDFVGPSVRLYWDQAVYKKPGVQKPFPWHQDNGYTFVSPQQYITVWIALNDATKDNGCMWFVPKVHKLGTVKHELTDLGYAMYCDRPPANAVPIECCAGTVIVLSALCPHMTGHNNTDKTRRALVAQFVEDGTYQLTSDVDTGEPIRQEVDDKFRQFMILRDGQPIA